MKLTLKMKEITLYGISEALVLSFLQKCFFIYLKNSKDVMRQQFTNFSVKREMSL